MKTTQHVPAIAQGAAFLLFLVILFRFGTPPTGRAPVEDALPAAAVRPDTAEESQTLTLAEAFSAARRQVQPITADHRELPENRDARYFAYNPAQELSGRFLDGAARFSVAGEPWAVTLKLQSVAGRPVNVRPAPRADGVRVDFDHSGGVNEWFINQPSVFEHGVTLAEPPAREVPGPFTVEFNLEGAEAVLHPDSPGNLSFVSPETGEPLMAYSKLHVFDSHGRTLPAEMRGQGTTVEITVDDTGAAYPISIDPDLSVERFKISASPAGADDEFGSAMDISGTNVLVGAPFDDGPMGANTGSVFAFAVTGESLSATGSLSVADLTADSRFGFSVAISGDTAIIGAPGFNGSAGRASIFTRSGLSWTLRTSFTANDNPTNRPIQFGGAVDLDGSTAVVGAPTWDADGFLVGQAYVFTGSAASWSQQAILQRASLLPSFDSFDLFGRAVAVSGNTALVGVPFDTTARGFQSGSVFVYNRSGVSWSEQTSLVPPKSGSSQAFGSALILAGNRALVGAPVSDGWVDDSGAVFEFARSGGTWGSAVTIAGFDSSAFDDFGRSLAFDGTNLIVGAPLDDIGSHTNAGSAYIFEADGTFWNEGPKLTAADAAANDTFGSAVAISSTFALVAAEGEDPGGVSNAGSLYLFTERRPPDLDLLLNGTPLTVSTPLTFGNAAFGHPVERTITVRNLGERPLFFSNLQVINFSSDNFEISDFPSSLLSPGENDSLTIAFRPVEEGSLSAELVIEAAEFDGPYNDRITLALNGSGFSNTIDSDGDGLTDGAEVRLAALGFNPTLAQPALVAALRDNSDAAGLFTQAQLQALKPSTPLIGRTSDGRFQLTLDLKKSTDLATFSDFAAAASGVSVNGQGDIVFEFTPTDDAAFYRLEID